MGVEVEDAEATPMLERRRQNHPSDRTDRELAVVATTIPDPSPDARSVKADKRKIAMAILCLLRSGCAKQTFAA
jgi:hypothetical protein